MQVPLNCTVAPSSESRRLPKRPQSVPSGRASNCVFLTCPWQEVDKYPTNTNTKPINAPPAAAAAVPNTDKPPLVPFGTGCITYVSCAPWFIQTSLTIQDSKDFLEKTSVSELQSTLKAPFPLESLRNQRTEPSPWPKGTSYACALLGGCTVYYV